MPIQSNPPGFQPSIGRTNSSQPVLRPPSALISPPRAQIVSEPVDRSQITPLPASRQTRTQQPFPLLFQNEPAPEAKGHASRGTGYYPANNRMEGGFVDKHGKPLRTLQDFLDGKASYVSIALDKKLYKTGQLKYGDTFRIPELEKKYGRVILFKAVDTGGAFTNKGFSRVDICTRSRAHSLDSTVNGPLTLVPYAPGR